jgi:3-deoxy-D-manno-octulosonic-acid transferase
MNFYDISYGAVLAISSPFWLARSRTRRKVSRALRERMGHDIGSGEQGPAVMIHAVSLGEINAARAMLQSLREARPELRFVISVTTDTGYARGQELYRSDPRVTLIRYPLDFTPAINRVLDAFRPIVVVLMELEVWPNFMLQCQRRGIPVMLVNGRLTSGSFRNYRLGGPLVRRMFRRLKMVCAQEQAYADRFVGLGAPVDRVRVTGTMKFDTAQIAEAIDGAEEVAGAVGLRPTEEPVWVCGSTGPGEETILLAAYRELLKWHPTLRLVLVPRKPERFDEVAELVKGDGFELIRRSQTQIANCELQIANCKLGGPVILGDTMGELRKFYSLADVVFVGRTLVDLGPRQHGSDMIEPAALARPTIVGPFTGNFAEVMNRFRAASAMREVASAMREVASADELVGAVLEALGEPAVAAEMGALAQEVVRQAQGATARNVALILTELDRVRNPTAGASV